MQRKISPLTLEGLKKMDGQPVWVVKKNSYAFDLSPASWGLVICRDSYVFSARIGLLGFNRYGESWIAYHFEVHNILESIAADVKRGKITLQESAEELYQAGLSNCVDIDKTKRLLKL